jgi:endonuclease/exonuclease/phosphatase family metal-dependent hydrolase
MSFSLASWNIWGLFADWGKRRQVLSRSWPEIEKPDFICLQEVCINNQYNQVNDLAEIMNYKYQSFAPALIRGDTVEGVAVLSNYPSRHTIIELPYEEQRRVALAIEVQELQLNIVSTHLSFYPPQENTSQIEFLLNYPDFNQTRTFVAADLNIVPEDLESLSYLFENWRIDTVFDYTWPNDIDQFKLGWREKTGYDPTFEIKQSQLDYIISNCLESQVIESKKYDLLIKDQYASDHSLIINQYQLD